MKVLEIYISFFLMFLPVTIIIAISEVTGFYILGSLLIPFFLIAPYVGIKSDMDARMAHYKRWSAQSAVECISESILETVMAEAAMKDRLSNEQLCK